MSDPNTIDKLAILQGGLDTPDATEHQEGLQPKTFTEREYDTEVIEDFLNMVFPELFEDEHILTQRVKPLMVPTSAPKTEQSLIQFANNSKQPRALYVSTATVSKDKNGVLYNRQAQFYRQHFFILDDIGTKGSEAIKDTLPPTYIIESSPKNYQYGYVFKEPIEDLEQAKAFISVVYETGAADTGGKLPNKYVRLPEGIHGKKGPTCEFVTRLVSSDGPTYTQDEVLTALDTGATWAEIQADAVEVLKQRTRMTGGTSLWSGAQPKLDTLTGITDVVAEWLLEEGELLEEGDPWMTVACPWADEHSDPTQTTAGYKPLGYGENPTVRGFHCFHDSCSDHKTSEYLHYVATNGGPEAAVKDEIAALVDEYVYDCIGDNAWQVKNTVTPVEMPLRNFRNFHPKICKYLGNDGKEHKTSEVNMWLTHPMRVTTHGAKFDPSTPARIVGYQDKLYVNRYSPPLWGDGNYDDYHVEKFETFIRYLIPAAEERDYFLDWLSAKAKDMAFRGAAIIMVALAQGVGRTSLTDMIKELFLQTNVRTEPFDKIAGDHNFNEWIESPFVVANETLNTSEVGYFKAYERLKEVIDPRPCEVTVNPKYGKQRRGMAYSSFLFLSNHMNALALSHADRRFYVIQNPNVPAEPAMFEDLNKWMEEKTPEGDPAWAQSVWRWLRSREVDVQELLKPPKATAAKIAMVESTKNGLDICCEALIRHWPSDILTFDLFADAIEEHYDRLRLDDKPNWRKIARTKLSAESGAFSTNTRLRLGNKLCRPRVLLGRPSAHTTWAEAGTRDTTKAERAELANILREFTPDHARMLKDNVTDEMDVAEL